VIRGLALGTLNEQTRNQFLAREFKMAVALSGILSVAGFCRAIFFKTPLLETVALTSALSLIVFSSVCLGAVLPILLEFIGVDPAHSSTSIQGTYRVDVLITDLDRKAILLHISHVANVVTQSSWTFWEYSWQ
jgi:Mg/Co/Ni transporter MgtE